MSFKPSQFIIAALAGVATALGVTIATIQSQSSFTDSKLPPQPSNSPLLSSPVPNPQAGINPVSPTIANNPESPAVDTPASPKPQPIVLSPRVTPKPQPIVVSPPDSGCKIGMALVIDPNPPLNVRDRPQVSESKIVGTLSNNTFVSVADEQNGWLRITDPISGWIAKNRTKSSCQNVNQRISFPAGGSEAIVQGQIIGGGSHSYLINATKGQTITLTNHQQVLPLILTPNGKVLADNSDLEGKTKWTGKVPVTGDYTLQLDSNFKGYKYDFSIELN
ncbi:SH3 domain-containing protein [Kamptonema sp. UHCC 0994]|uniref:SH3 domain-containing protein n=1 Tax=Kamptonema sp. UHCC 0994 TaxID=3031329 RepID=UPI0023B8A6D7|nr:SH3 domain-containing protein [Kamptonema sp. UHCC 0994]MDF0551662.1 SH3 domain-containing protein [Kamptonema sp. UHCC 0994]